MGGATDTNPTLRPVSCVRGCNNPFRYEAPLFAPRLVVKKLLTSVSGVSVATIKPKTVEYLCLVLVNALQTLHRCAIQL